MKLNSKLFLVFALWLLAPLFAIAQQYSVSYDETEIEQVIFDLRKKTGYDFIYQKQIIENVPPVTGTFNNMTLVQLLDRIIYTHARLDYEIVDKSVILSPLKEDAAYFKKIVSGMVEDEAGEPLASAVVSLEGTETYAVADVDGQFVITVEGKAPVLKVTFIGMKDYIVRVDPKNETSFFLIKMESDATLLEEVLVTGFQNIKRESATGSYQTITSKDMDNRHSTSIVSDLEGRIPGMMSYNNGISEDGEAGLTIRGTGSFQARTNPLVVVDGLPIEGSIETVNPYDIESIVVLKDASAAAIYGARASNGVIVITTKQAQDSKVTIDFSSDITISEKNDYSNFRWVNAAELIELEKYNYDYVLGLGETSSAFTSLLDRYETNRHAMSQVSRLLVANYRGEISTDQMNGILDEWSKNDYRKEWQDAAERNSIIQQYNLAVRSKGKYLASSLVVNYKGDNNGMVNEYDRALAINYKGDLTLNKWLNFNFGVNIINEKSKEHLSSSWNGINSFMPYQSMFNADGSRAGMEADVWLGEESLSNPEYGLKSISYNLLDELDINFNNTRSTNIRSYIHANVNILPGWSASAKFQYEDINLRSESHYEADSYYMRHLYNSYTLQDWAEDIDPDTFEPVLKPVAVHYIPEGGRLDTYNLQQDYYTFRAQTQYSNTINGKHALDGVAGFEFRESRSRSNTNLLMGYDEQTQTNSNGLLNYGELNDLYGSPNLMGDNYQAYGAPDGSSFTTTDVLHRFYSLYFSGNYTYDSCYSLSASVRLDKTDLFGADPKFRGRPLWSVGMSWNINNESFMRNVEWVNVLKLRASYGLTGNIDSSVSSYLTATIGINGISGDKYASLDTPPNDQLRWEKTESWNAGLDFSIFRNRLMGSLDVYNKYGSDLLTVVDLDPTTGFTQLTINNGEMVNRGVEVQLDGSILQPRKGKGLGINASLSFSYNKNEVTKVNHEPTSGYEALGSYTLHEGYPIHSLFSYRFAGLVADGDLQYFSWKKANGEISTSDINYEDFTVDDVVFSGTLDPKYMVSFSPEVTYAGFTLSAMFTYYGGHYMRARVSDWGTSGDQYGYRIDGGGIPKAYLDYWRNGQDNTEYVANGYPGGYFNVIGVPQYMDANVVPADYFKLRNLTLSYNFPERICNAIGMRGLRIRAQMNNFSSWYLNNVGIDPEAVNPSSGADLIKTPRSYTMSLQFTF